MKIFHLSDLHIGIKLINYDLTEDQEYIFKQIAEYAKEEKPDAFLIAGDIYDKAVPSAEAYELFDKFINMLLEAVPDAVIMMISGNHDSASRVNTFRNVLAKQNFYMIGNPPTKENEFIEKVVLQDEHGDINFYLLPFVKPSMIKQIVGVDANGNNLSYNEAVKRLIQREDIDTNKRNVIVSHQFYLPEGQNPEEFERMESEIVTVGNIDQVSSVVLEAFDYAALGHIHKPMKVGNENYRYCGTPISYSVSEAGQKKGIVVVDFKEKGNIATKVLDLIPLREVKIIEGTLEEVLLQATDDYVRIVLTDKVDIDVIDMRDRIQNAFPHFLEIQREALKKVNYNGELQKQEILEPFELCTRFLPGLDSKEIELLQDVINTVKGV